MSTQTPRTDAAYAEWQSSWTRTPFGPDFARTLERELSESRNAERLARVQLGAEREKVQVLKLDKDRLDWWNGEPYYQFGKSHKCMNPGWWWSCGFESGMHGKSGIKNIRDAIDSAMAHSKSGRNKYNVCKRIEQSSTEDDK